MTQTREVICAFSLTFEDVLLLHQLLFLKFYSCRNYIFYQPFYIGPLIRPKIKMKPLLLDKKAILIRPKIRIKFLQFDKKGCYE